MRSRLTILALCAAVAAASPSTPLTGPAVAQSSTSHRDAMRDQLGELLATAGKRNDVNIDFRRSDKNPYNYVGVTKTGLKNVDFFEVVIGVSDKDTIRVSIYPHYKGAYVNLGRARDAQGLMKALLRFSDTNFMYWGADDSGDTFAAFEFTLESGFPADAMTVVLRSIAAQDQFVGQLRPFIDGTTPS